MNLHNNEISQRLLNAKSVEQIKKLIEEKIDIHQSIFITNNFQYTIN